MHDHETPRRDYPGDAVATTPGPIDALDGRVAALAPTGGEIRAPWVNEREVRAAAGVTMVIGAVGFSYAYFDKQYAPLQIVASLFFIEFLIRVTAGIRYSPIGVIARGMTLGQPPQWVSATPKRFAWTLGLAMALAMATITNSGIRGYLPRTICLICLTLMWMESALGLCLGCKIHTLIARRGWSVSDHGFEVCTDCHGEPADRTSPPLEDEPRMRVTRQGRDQTAPFSAHTTERGHMATASLVLDTDSFDLSHRRDRPPIDETR